jgi:hypothetical protein
MMKIYKIKTVGDMFLSAIQSMTGLKVFDKDTLAIKGTSTGKNTVSTANTTAIDYTNTLPAKDGTFAMVEDIDDLLPLIYAGL